MVSIIDSDGLVEVIDFSKEQPSKVMAGEILKERPYSCLVFRLSKRKEVARSKSKKEHLFDISKVDQIFNHLLRNQQIKLPKGHKIPRLKN